MLHLFQTQYLVALRLQTTRTCVNKYKTPVHKNQDVNESFLFIVISNKFEHQTLFKSTNFLEHEIQYTKYIPKMLNFVVRLVVAGNLLSLRIKVTGLNTGKCTAFDVTG